MTKIERLERVETSCDACLFLTHISNIAKDSAALVNKHGDEVCDDGIKEMIEDAYYLLLEILRAAWSKCKTEEKDGYDT